jgi:mono/diheme cytochrome c family protein
MKGYFLKVVIFVAGLLSAFVLMARSIPQQDSQPPAKEAFDVTAIKTKADLVDAGQQIFFGKGQCALCHSIGPSAGARCPDLKGFGAKLSREFIYESLITPDRYLYMDYTISPPKKFPATMPPINKPPIGLSEPELLAVVSFLQRQGGEVTVEPGELTAFLPVAEAQGDAEMGRKVYERSACGRCHEDRLAGPLKKYDQARLQRAIIRPAGGPKAAEAHRDFDRKLTVKDLDDLTTYLIGLKTAEKS